MTLNPALDYNITLNSFSEGKVNRSESEQMIAGGKGLMVSQMLQNLGVESTALGLVAGFTGEELTRMVHEAGIRTNFVTLSEGMTRINVKLWGGLEGEINAKGPKCDEKSLKALLGKLSVLGSEDILCLSGTIPKSLPEDLYADILKKANEQGVRVAVDATGELLRRVVPYRPFLIKPNHHELSEIFGVPIEIKEEAAKYALKLHEEGAKNVLVSMAGEGAVLVDENGFVWYGEAPKGQVKNTVGSGDSMVAGFLSAYSSDKHCAVKDAFLLSIASGSASAFSETLGKKSEVEALKPKVQVTKVEK